MKFIKLIILTVVTVIAVTFSLSNRTQVALSFYPFSYELHLPLFLLLFLSFIIGITIGGSSSIIKTLKLRRAARSSKKQLAKVEKELVTLKDKVESGQVS